MHLAAFLAGFAGALAGPWLARLSVRFAHGDAGARPSVARIAVTAVLSGVLLGGAVALGGNRPATLALGWAAVAAVVLGAVDLAAHRLPDRVTYPAVAVCLAALAADAVVTGGWGALGRAVLAALVSGGLGLGVWLAAPAALGLGDVKLLALLGLVLGWAGWGVLMTGVLLGLVAGSVLSLVLVAGKRAGWRTALPFGPPLLLGAVVALALAGPLPG